MLELYEHIVVVGIETTILLLLLFVVVWVLYDVTHVRFWRD